MSPVADTHVLRTVRLRLLPVLTGASPEELALLAARVETGAEDATPAPERLEHARRTVQRSSDAFAAHGYGLWWIVPAESAVPAGWCGLKDGDDPTRPELMYGLRVGSRGAGYATEAVRALVAHALALPNVVAVWGATRPENAASASVMLRAGLHAQGSRLLDGRDYLVFSTTNATT